MSDWGPPGLLPDGQQRDPQERDGADQGGHQQLGPGRGQQPRHRHPRHSCHIASGKYSCHVAWKSEREKERKRTTTRLLREYVHCICTCTNPQYLIRFMPDLDTTAASDPGQTSLHPTLHCKAESPVWAWPELIICIVYISSFYWLV